MSYWLWAIFLSIALFGASLLTLIGLPGNWAMVGLTAVFAYFFPVVGSIGISWTVVLVMLGLAVVGEVLEFALGAASVTKGGSRRGAVLAIIGSFIGSFAGAAIGSPLPVLGPLVGIVVFASFGAMVGAVLGELSLGKQYEQSMEIGKAAFWGRLLGSVVKWVIGATILTTAIFAAFL